MLRNLMRIFGLIWITMFCHKYVPILMGKNGTGFPGIKGSRTAYKAFGRNPSRYRVSSEALIRRIRRGDELYHINSVVDVNNLFSVKSGLSVGSYDLEKIHGEITLRKAVQGEGYTGIGKDFWIWRICLFLQTKTAFLVHPCPILPAQW